MTTADATEITDDELHILRTNIYLPASALVCIPRNASCWIRLADGRTMTSRRMEEIFTTIPQEYRDRAYEAWRRHGDHREAQPEFETIAREWLDSTCSQPGLW
ncbi:hypothetical protein AXK56_22595 [Tsukamurella pulmonis]|uniref:Uncharacterized protein n=1 Tax=Tsukamurella pulmonis TaxID=47312 RepID=A0A1H1ADJ8_9ACTN|nr:hypothetical protein [Tsukamurella pulmonis]KXO92797.1 hypothetical protein AXK56_22595 [Tsukamurella pulmonis]SDQ37717.1 hypothetical protein SAMN04489765_0172 [Tsukamurella pulmonis]SUQ39364.1 Uncharacterised protein [Tsukamurella pulmonis]